MKSNDKSELPVVPLPLAIVIIIVASQCFLRSYDGKFAFDDTEAIVNNEDVKDIFTLNLFKNDFWGTKLSHKHSHKSYRPLTILSFRIHYWLRGYLEPHDFHIVNIILHTVVSVLTLFVFDVLLGSDVRNVAFYATILFTIHPVHTESVAGIVGRADLLCTLFAWMSILFYNRSILSVGVFFRCSNMIACVACITVAMFCKETGITAAGICCIYEIVVVNKIYPIDLISRDLLKLKYSHKAAVQLLSSKLDCLLRLATMCTTATILLLLRFSIMGFSPPTFRVVDNPASFMDNVIFRVLNYNYIYCLNAWLLICPEWLCFDWSMGCVPLILGYDSRISAIIILWLTLATFGVYIFSAGRSLHVRHTVMALTLLVVPFLPASNVFFNVGFVLAERTLYIPSAGYCLLLTIGLRRLVNRVPLPKTLLSLYVLLIVTFCARSWKRSDEWRTEMTLFRSALKVCPLNAKVHYNIAKTAADLGNSTYAELEYREALRLNPEYAQAMNNLGNLLKDQRKYVEAEELLKQAVELQNDFATAWMNLGIVLSALKKYAESEKSYITALSHRPKYPDCHYNLGVLYLEWKHYENALKAWGNTIRQEPTHRRAWTNTILLLDNLGRSEEALSTAAKALKVIPDEASVYFNIANILGKAGKFEEAEYQFKTAITKDSGNPTFYANLGVLYHRWHKRDEAERMYRRALKIEPNLQSARDNLKKLKDMKSAIK